MSVLLAPHVLIDGVMMKRCGPGDHLAPLESFCRRPKRWDGLNSVCRACDAQRCAQWAAAHREELKQYHHDYYEANKPFLLAKDQIYRRDNIVACREREREYAHAHREERRAYKRAYHLKHRLRINAKSRLFYRKYLQERPEILRAQRVLQAARRRTMLRGLPYDFTEEDAVFAFAYAQGRCMACGAEAGLWQTLALDHWWPIAGTERLCPGTVVGNMVVLCHVGGHRRGGKPMEIPGCNNSKGHRNPDVWLREQFGSRRAARKMEEIETFFQEARTDAARRREVSV
jgi:hypothetical protein